MYLLAHTDAKFTMRVYQQVLDMGGSGPEQLETLLDCSAEQAFVVLSGRDVWAPIGHPAGKIATGQALTAGPEGQETPH